jgi:hypothetical protein
LLGLPLEEVEQHEAWVGRVSERIAALLPAPFAEAVQRLATIPGIDERAAENILAEVGTDMGQFPSAAPLASWVGLCPGNRQSASKRQSGRTTKGNRWLRATLVQVAWAASHTKDTYLAAQYRRLAGRRGKKKALVALGHTILVILYHLLKGRTTYRELGPDYFDHLDTERLTRTLVRRGWSGWVTASPSSRRSPRPNGTGQQRDRDGTLCTLWPGRGAARPAARPPAGTRLEPAAVQPQGLADRPRR